jgi:hypothetical protein
MPGHIGWAATALAIPVMWGFAYLSVAGKQPTASVSVLCAGSDRVIRAPLPSGACAAGERAVTALGPPAASTGSATPVLPATTYERRISSLGLLIRDRDKVRRPPLHLLRRHPHRLGRHPLDARRPG